MFNSSRECVEYIREAGIDMVDFKMADLWGRWRHLTAPARKVTEEVLDEGFGFDASNYGFLTVDKSDMVLIPDLKTAFEEEWQDNRILSFICEIRVVDGDEPRFEQDPRYICLKAENIVKKLGIADEIKILPEFEFYVFDNIDFDNRPDMAFYKMHSSCAGWESENSNQGFFIRGRSGYQVAPPHDMLFNYRIELVKAIEECGVQVKYHHHEIGAPGQIEIEVDFNTPTRTADSALLLKYVAQNLALKHNKTATFMPKPIYGEAGSGMHMHIKLYKDGKNIFADRKGYAGLSKIAHNFIGGVLTHAKSLMAFTNPSTNSYKRLVPGFEAPTAIVYATGNRSAAIRIPGYAKSDEDKRFEYRPPDATCNPYLAFAAFIMAGVDGIEKKIDPVAAGFGPYEVNFYELPESEKSRIGMLPENLSGALNELESDHHYLLNHGIFTEHLLKSWVTSKRKEVIEIRNRPHPYEFYLYYDI